MGVGFSIRKEHRIKGIDVIIQDALTEIYRNGYSSTPFLPFLPSSQSLFPLLKVKKPPLVMTPEWSSWPGIRIDDSSLKLSSD